MTHSISMFSQIDPAAQRRRALARVYSLLFRLAEEAEKHTTPPEIVIEKKAKIEKPTLAETNTFKQSVFPFFDPEVSTLPTEQKNNSVSLQNNIPS